MITRRTFVKGLAAGGAATAFGGYVPRAAADPGKLAPQQTLRGAVFDLAIGETMANFTGASKVALTINGSIPGPLPTPPLHERLMALREERGLTQPQLSRLVDGVGFDMIRGIVSK